MSMHPDKIRRLMMQHGNKIFKVTFARRNDKVIDGQIVAKAGELRTMVCRLHVKRGVKGTTDRKSEDRQHDCMTVFEMAGDESGFKRVPLDSVVDMTLAPKPEGA